MKDNKQENSAHNLALMRGLAKFRSMQQRQENTDAVEAQLLSKKLSLKAPAPAPARRKVTTNLNLENIENLHKAQDSAVDANNISYQESANKQSIERAAALLKRANSRDANASSEPSALALSALKGKRPTPSQVQDLSASLEDAIEPLKQKDSNTNIDDGAPDRAHELESAQQLEPAQQLESAQQLEPASNDARDANPSTNSSTTENTTAKNTVKSTPKSITKAKAARLNPKDKELHITLGQEHSLPSQQKATDSTLDAKVLCSASSMQEPNNVAALELNTQDVSTTVTLDNNQALNISATSDLISATKKAAAPQAPAPSSSSSPSPAADPVEPITSAQSSELKAEDGLTKAISNTSPVSSQLETEPVLETATAAAQSAALSAAVKTEDRKPEDGLTEAISSTSPVSSQLETDLALETATAAAQSADQSAAVKAEDGLLEAISSTSPVSTQLETKPVLESATAAAQSTAVKAEDRKAEDGLTEAISSTSPLSSQLETEPVLESVTAATQSAALKAEDRKAEDGLTEAISNTSPVSSQLETEPALESATAAAQSAAVKAEDRKAEDGLPEAITNTIDQLEVEPLVENAQTLDTATTNNESTSDAVAMAMDSLSLESVKGSKLGEGEGESVSDGVSVSDSHGASADASDSTGASAIDGTDVSAAKGDKESRSKGKAIKDSLSNASAEFEASAETENKAKAKTKPSLETKVEAEADVEASAEAAAETETKANAKAKAKPRARKGSNDIAKNYSEFVRRFGSTTASITERTNGFMDHVFNSESKILGKRYKYTLQEHEHLCLEQNLFGSGLKLNETNVDKKISLLELLLVLLSQNNYVLEHANKPKSSEVKYSFIKRQALTLRRIVFNNPMVERINTSQGSDDEKWLSWQLDFNEFNQKSDANYKLDPAHYNLLKRAFNNFDNFTKAITLLRSWAIVPHKAKSWTEHFLFPFGAESLFYDASDNVAKGASHHCTNFGQLLFTMLMRANTKCTPNQQNALLMLCDCFFEQHEGFNVFAQILGDSFSSGEDEIIAYLRSQLSEDKESQQAKAEQGTAKPAEAAQDAEVAPDKADLAEDKNGQAEHLFVACPNVFKQASKDLLQECEFVPYLSHRCFDQLEEDFRQLLSLNLTKQQLLKSLSVMGMLNILIYFLEQEKRLASINNSKNVPNIDLVLSLGNRASPRVAKLASDRLQANDKLHSLALQNFINQRLNLLIRCCVSYFTEDLKLDPKEQALVCNLTRVAFNFATNKAIAIDLNGKGSIYVHDNIDPREINQSYKRAPNPFNIVQESQPYPSYKNVLNTISNALITHTGNNQSPHRDLAIEIGLISGTQKAHQYYSFSDELLRTLVLCCVDKNKSMIMLSEFLQKLYERYHLVIGPQQAHYYYSSNTQGHSNHIEEKEFKKNLNELIAQLKRMDLLINLSDSCEYVTNPFSIHS